MPRVASSVLISLISSATLIPDVAARVVAIAAFAPVAVAVNALDATDRGATKFLDEMAHYTGF